MPKAIKKLNPKNFTQDEYNKRVIDGMASGEIKLGYYPAELRPKKDQDPPKAKS